MAFHVHSNEAIVGPRNTAQAFLLAPREERAVHVPYLREFNLAHTPASEGGRGVPLAQGTRAATARQA